MNKSIMMGRVVNEPDLRYTQTENGELAIANFRLAVDRKFVRRGDPEADFFSCTAFGRKAEFAEKYLFKGIKILVEGRMQNDNYKNRAGENVYGMRLMIEEISFAESKKALESGNDEREEPERETRASSNRNRSDRAENQRSASRSSRSGREAEVDEKQKWMTATMTENVKVEDTEAVPGQMHRMTDGDQILAGQDPEELRQEAGSVVRILMTGTWKQMMKNWILTEQIIGGNAYDGENEQMVVCT